MEFSKLCYNLKMGNGDKNNFKMGDHGDDDIVEAIKEEVTDAAKAVVADVKAIAHEVADAIAEGTGHEHAHPHLFQPPDDDRDDAAPVAKATDASHRDNAAGGTTSVKKPG